jgi:hypothetical protein
MQQIADWLENLGMSEYAQRFAENRIDFSVLPELTDQDLEKLGVIFGDRRKMLRAIANLQAVDATIGLSEIRRGDRAALRRVRGEVHGRRGAGVFRLSASTRR